MRMFGGVHYGQRLAGAIIGYMDERELTHWLDALVKQGLIGDWHWSLHVEPGAPAAGCYLIDGQPYTQAGAMRLVREFEVSLFVNCAIGSHS